MSELLSVYSAAVKDGDIEADTTQLDVVRALDELLNKLKHPASRWFPWQKKQFVKGVYLYGPVGVGKTYLMDLFYQHLPAGMGTRYHFHHFMQQVDAQLRKRQGQRDPLKHLAKELARKTRVLCFDEFMVHDVAHAMILAELFTQLFAHDLVLVATSNTLPEHLYLNGVQRQRFLPAIALIKQHCQVMTLVARRDYRLGREPLASAWYNPVTEENTRSMREQFQQLGGRLQATDLCIQNRRVQCLGLAKEGVWFSFSQICTLPRSQLDYLEIANRFDYLFISDIPQLGPRQTSEAILFIYLVDIMYDYGVRLVLSSQVEIDELCKNPEMEKEFQRTRSRLKEMQSVDYARRHQHRIVKNF